MKNHVIAAQVAVDDGSLVARRWYVGRQPLDQSVHVRVASRRLIFQVLFAPARHLPLEIAAYPTKILEPDAAIVDAVKLRQGGVHRVEIRRPLISGHLGKRRVPEDPSRNHLHDVEPRSNNGLVRAYTQYCRYGKTRLRQRSHHTRLAVYRMRAFQQDPGWLAPQDVTARRCNQFVCRIGLPSFELLHHERTRVAVNMLVHPALEARFVEAVALTDGCGPEVIERVTDHEECACM